MPLEGFGGTWLGPFQEALGIVQAYAFSTLQRPRRTKWTSLEVRAEAPEMVVAARILGRSVVMVLESFEAPPKVSVISFSTAAPSCMDVPGVFGGARSGWFEQSFGIVQAMQGYPFLAFSVADVYHMVIPGRCWWCLVGMV